MSRYEERCEAISELYEAAINHAQLSQIPLALASTRFLSPDNCRITEPFALGGNWCLLGKDSDQIVSITPLYADDREVHAHFANLINKSVPTYYETERSIYFPVDKYSPTIGGLVLIHEGIHAYAHHAGIWRNIQGGWSHWLEEVHTFTAEFQVLEALAGSIYRRAVIEKAAELDYKMYQGRISRQDVLATIQQTTQVLNQLVDDFNEHDFEIMQTILGISATFYALNDGVCHNDTSVMRSAHFLHYLYNADDDPVPLPTLRAPLEITK